MSASFRLARLLRLRAQVRQLRQHEADELAREAAALEGTVRVLDAERERRAAAEADSAARGELTPAALHLGRTYDGALADRERATAAALADRRAALQAKREELAHERREERKFRHLEDAHRQRVGAEEARRAGNVLDELAVQGHTRRRKEQHHGDDD